MAYHTRYPKAAERIARAVKAADKWRLKNIAAPWSAMFWDVLRAQDHAGKEADLRLDALADVLLARAMDPGSPFTEDHNFAQEQSE